MVPELVTVTVWVADETPTIGAGEGQAGRVRVEDRARAPRPVPESGTVLVMPDAVTVRLPVRAPAGGRGERAR